ncbi:MAG TPA: response regulator [Thermoanaerobaculia bacterium]|nr:response regulator [Thermoanaerobaculia bacterium]
MVDTRSVLIADDDQSIRQLLRTIVQREGLAADCASDGLEAIEKLRAREYAVILLDLMMPRADGFEVIEYLKTNAPQQKPVVLVITAYADQRFKKVDPDIVAGVLRKPFEVTELGALVRLCSAGYQEEVVQRRSSAGGRATTDLGGEGSEDLSHAYTSN